MPEIVSGSDGTLSCVKTTATASPPNTSRTPMTVSNPDPRISYLANSLPGIGVGGVAQAIPQEVKTEHRAHNKHNGRQNPGVLAQRLNILRIAHHQAPANQRLCNANPQKTQEGCRQTNAGNRQREEDNNRAQHGRTQAAEAAAAGGSAQDVSPPQE